LAIINTKQKLNEWIQRKLGAPVINLETELEQVNDNIDDAIQRFTKYSGDATYRNALIIPISAGEETYTLNSSVISVLSLDMIKDVTDGINILFSPMNQMYQQGFFDFLFKGSSGGSLVTYEMGMEYLDMAKDILGGDFFTQFNKYSKTLTLTPTPNENGVGICEVYTKYDTGTSDSEIYDEIWIKEYALALTKMNLGHIWGKYNGTPLPGGGSLNAQSIMDAGTKEKDKLDDRLIKDEAEPLDFLIE
jgi:hypothetical protein